MEIDVRGYSRGIPTIRTQQAVKDHPGQSLVVVADTGWARDDVVRLARKMGYTSQVIDKDAGYWIEITPA
jgi:TusA-related sulfurtransferase